MCHNNIKSANRLRASQKIGYENFKSGMYILYAQSVFFSFFVDKRDVGLYCFVNQRTFIYKQKIQNKII